MERRLTAILAADVVGYLRSLPLSDPGLEDRRRSAFQLAGLPD